MTLRLFTFFYAIIWAVTVPVQAQVAEDSGEDPFAFEDPGLRDEISAPKSGRVAQEFSLDVTYVADMEMEQGNASFGDVETLQTQLSYVVSPEVADGFLLRLGGNFNRFSFGLPSQSPIPNTLQGYNAIIGFDWAMSDQWLMRFEVQPGIYNTNSDVRWNDVNVPIVIGVSYLQSPQVQWVLGLSVDLWREYPVLPGAGVRWQIADDWVLNAIVPRPRLEYKLNKAIDLFVGAELVGGSFRSSVDHGSTHGNDKLNDTPISYSEVRVGGGLIWRLNPGLSVNLNGGWVPFRRMDFNRADTQFDKASEGAPYGQIAITGSF